jgi:hypothetical protein
VAATRSVGGGHVGFGMVMEFRIIFYGGRVLLLGFLS